MSRVTQSTLTDSQRESLQYYTGSWPISPFDFSKPSTPDSGTLPSLPQVTWNPLPGPQSLAWNSPAQTLGYGGSPGGGKTDLLLGLAGMQHRRAVIFRREFPRVRAIIERSREVFAPNPEDHAKDSYNEQLHLWRLRGSRTIEFASMQREEHKKNYQGRPYDFHGFDEATEFSESQVRFVTGWNRSAVPGQRCRAVLTFNPPLDDTGLWVIKFFGPWIDPDYTGERAMPGELRWFISTDDGDREVPAGTKHAKSRTFIPAALADNPFLVETDYESTLLALPFEVREVLLGNFANAGKQSNPWAVIPRAWIEAAQRRWTAERPSGPPSAVGQDVARGGKDNTVNARWYGAWVDHLQIVPGAQTPDGPSAAGLLINDIAHGALIGVDIIGVGGSSFDSLKMAGASVIGVNFSESAGELRDRSKRLRFYNVRAAAYWKMREALDPDHGDNIALPPDPLLLQELAAARYSLTARGILVEEKDDIIERIGRSPDRADAVVIGHWASTGSSAMQLLNFYRRQAAQQKEETR